MTDMSVSDQPTEYKAQNKVRFVTAASLFVFRSRQPNVDGYKTPGHPYTTGLFVLACAAIVITTLVSYPKDSALGWLILLAGIPVYGYWRRKR